MDTDPHPEQEAIETFVDEIRSERESLLRSLDDVARRRREVTDDALQQPSDAADASQAQQTVDRLDAEGERIARRIDALNALMERAATGRVAVCDACGGPIRLARLRAVPGTTRCARCARDAEAEGPTGVR